MPQMKGSSFRPKPGKGGSAVTKMMRPPARMFRPHNPRPVLDYHQGIERACSGSGESARERKDRLVG